MPTVAQLKVAAGVLGGGERPLASDGKAVWAAHVLATLESASRDALKQAGAELGITDARAHGNANAAATWRSAIAEAVAPHAVDAGRTSTPPNPALPAATQPRSPPDDLATLTLNELKERARRLGIDDPLGHKGHKETWRAAIEGHPAFGPSSASTSAASASSPAPTAAPARDLSAPPLEDGGVALLIGASQDPINLAGVSRKELTGIDFRARYVPRRASALASRGSNALPDVLRDVQTMKRFFEARELPGVHVHTSFVGKDESGALTRVAFRSKLNRMLATAGKRVFILYFAGHGSGDAAHRGALVVEDGVITFEDLLECWEAKPIGARRSQYFIVIADSCHSGALRDSLAKLDKARKDVLNMAVQAACGADELSAGGVFTETFTGKQRTPAVHFEWQKIFEDQRPTCSECGAFFTESCRQCRRIHRDMGYPRSKEDVQHPAFFCTWKCEQTGPPAVPVSSAALRFFKRDRTAPRGAKP
ncbi:hypothetical protein KFE25_006308 [Diacronema lutheri]|uniref:Peptidase C14 caspase domain-containing protein n=1 Tax=Diacronema lutheri TaxID=2081491 RepID=A0A8J6CJE6_DIALT|nr:hypothetical protein KFE25_006308 [Diacronema lutheri]